MKEILRTNNPVKLNAALHYLRDQDIHAVEFDRHASVIEGSIGAIQRRIMVLDEDYDAAYEILSALKMFD